MKMHSNPVATRKTFITATSNQKRANVTDSATSYGSTHHSAKHINERRPKIPKVDRQALPEKLKATQNIPKKHC